MGCSRLLLKNQNLPFMWVPVLVTLNGIVVLTFYFMVTTVIDVVICILEQLKLSPEQFRFVEAILTKRLINQQSHFLRVGAMCRVPR